MGRLAAVQTQKEQAERERSAEALPLQVVERPDEPVAHAGPRIAEASLSRLRLLPLALPLVMIGGLVGVYFQPPLLMTLVGFLPPRAEPVVPSQPLPAQASARSTFRPGNVADASGNGFVAGLGRLLPQGDLRVIAPPFGAGDARIKTLAVKEGDRVEQGAVIAVLDNEASLKAALASSEATVASRDAALRQAKDVAIASREEARASLARAQSGVVNARREFDRVVELRSKGFAAEASFDARRAAYEQAVQDVERAKATLSRYLFDRVEDQPDIVVAQRALEAAHVEVERSRIELDKAYVRAPIAGTILTIHVRPGEKPGSQGVVNLGDIDAMTAEIEVYQTLIGRVAVGAEVRLEADALSRPLEGSVTRLGYEVKRQTATDATPAANTDARVVIVHVALAPGSAEIARRFTNLQVTARIVASAP